MGDFIFLKASFGYPYFNEEPAAETAGYLNVRNCFLYSLVTPGKPTGNALAIRFNQMLNRD